MTLVVDHSGKVFRNRKPTIKDVTVNGEARHGMKQLLSYRMFFVDKCSNGWIVINGPGAVGGDQRERRELQVILQDSGPSYTAPLFHEKNVPHRSCFRTTCGTRLGSEACQSPETLGALIVLNMRPQLISNLKNFVEIFLLDR